jgi:hypothetical protein
MKQVPVTNLVLQLEVGVVKTLKQGTLGPDKSRVNDAIGAVLLALIHVVLELVKVGEARPPSGVDARRPIEDSNIVYAGSLVELNSHSLNQGRGAKQECCLVPKEHSLENVALGTSANLPLRHLIDLPRLHAICTLK